MSTNCPACHGTGAAWTGISPTIAHSGPCEYCGGEGRVSKTKADEWPQHMDRILNQRAQKESRT